MKDRRIIIWGKDNYNVLGLLHQLKEYQNNLFLLLYGKRKYCATLSRYCHNYSFVKSVQEGYDYLRSHFNNEKLKPIIIPTNDLVAESLDFHQIEFKDKYLFSFTQTKSLSSYLDKMVMHEIAQSCGINVPKSYYLCDDKSAAKVGFPCIIKPVKRFVDRSAKFKFKLCDDRNALDEVVASIDDVNDYLIQEYIEKACDYLVYGCRNINGDVILPCVFKKERWYEGDGSYGVILKEIPSFINKGGISQFLEKTGYYGLFSFEYGISGDKSYYYETNFRNDGTSHYYYQAGVNLPLYWVLNLCKDDVKDYNLLIDKEQKFIDEVYDFDNVRLKKVDKKTWRREKKEATIYKYYDRHDPLPYYFQVLYNFAYRVYNFFK